jgi:hypothetical protein
LSPPPRLDFLGLLRFRTIVLDGNDRSSAAAIRPPAIHITKALEKAHGDFDEWADALHNGITRIAGSSITIPARPMVHHCGTSL